MLFLENLWRKFKIIFFLQYISGGNTAPVFTFLDWKFLLPRYQKHCLHNGKARSTNSNIILHDSVNPFTAQSAQERAGLRKFPSQWFTFSEFTVLPAYCCPCIDRSLQSGPKWSFWFHRLFADGSTAMCELICSLTTLIGIVTNHSRAGGTWRADPL
jgi:hypothetical protein